MSRLEQARALVNLGQGLRERSQREPAREALTQGIDLAQRCGAGALIDTPGGSHEFFKELGPVARAATPDRAAIAAVFEKHEITLLGPPLTAD